MKISLKELKADLNKRCRRSENNYDGDTSYWQEKLFDHDVRIFRRRSFGDIFRHYRPMGVSEKMLLKALVESGFTAYICHGVQLAVWFKFTKDYRFWTYKPGKDEDYYDVKDKYTKPYLNKLYEEIFEE